MNLKYHFYKGYYEGVDFRDKEKQAKDLFYNKNKKLTKVKFPEASLRSNALIHQLNAIKVDHLKSIQLKTTYPGLIIGSGYLHELNMDEELSLGFYFDHSTGLPVIPGSSVKGVLRSYFPGFKYEEKDKPFSVDYESVQNSLSRIKARFLSKFFDICKDKSEPKKFEIIHELELNLFESLDTLRIQQETKDDSIDAGLRFKTLGQRSIFLEAQLSKENDQKEIMATDYITPHKGKTKNPIPISFLKVRPNIIFDFLFMLQNIALSFGEIKSSELIKLFREILLSNGIGAKTNVGYGKFVTTDTKIEKKKKGVYQELDQIFQFESSKKKKIVTNKLKSLEKNNQTFSAELKQARNNTLVFSSSAISDWDQDIVVKNVESNKFYKLKKHIGSSFEIKINQISRSGKPEFILVRYDPL